MHLLPRYYKCPGSAYDTETADGCTGAYLIHWDTDTTGQKVAMVFTWILLGAVFLALIYSGWGVLVAHWKYRHVPRAQRPTRRQSWKEAWRFQLPWRRDRDTAKTTMNEGLYAPPMGAPIGPPMATRPDPPSNAPLAPPLPPPKPTAQPVLAYNRQQMQDAEKETRNADSTIKEVGRVPWIGKMGRGKKEEDDGVVR